MLAIKNGSGPSQRQRLGDPAALIEKFFTLVRNQDPGGCPGRKMRLDLARQIMHIDDRCFDPGHGETIEHMVDQRLASDRKQWLRHAIGQRPHPRPQSRGEDHDFGGQERGH